MKNRKHSNNRMENISKEIFTDMQDGRSVSEEQLWIFFDGIADLMSSRRKMRPESVGLFEHICRTWAYRDFDGKSPEDIFILGAMWGSFVVLREKTNRERMCGFLKKIFRIFKL